MKHSLRLVALLASLLFCGAAKPPVPREETYPLGDWVATGAGQALPPAGFAQEGPLPLAVTDPKLGQGESYVIGGEVVLGKTGSIQVQFTDPHLGAEKPRAPAKKAAEQPDDGPLAPLPALTIQPDGITMKAGRYDEYPISAAHRLGLPMAIEVGRDAVSVSIGSYQTNLRRPLGQEVKVYLVLNGGAEVRALQVTKMPETPLQPLATLAAVANISLAGDAAKIDPASLPKGSATIDGVPFFFTDGPLNAVDVAASMKGLVDPFKNADFYNDKATNTNGRSVLSVAGDQYSALHVIAFSAGRPEHAPRMTVRVGFYGNRANILEDVVAEVPTLTAGGAQSIPVKLANGKAGYLHHVRVPMAKTANVKEFAQYRLEFTRDMQTHITPPDPSAYGKIPVGLPSDVVVVAATLERSPVTMSYTADQGGNVFFDTQKVRFTLSLSNRSDQPAEVRAYAISSGPGTGEETGLVPKERTVDQAVKLKAGESQEVVLDLTPGQRGWYRCQIGVQAGDVVLQQRDTTFAVLAPDTRQARAESPFGIWEFWEAHTARRNPNQTEILASLMNKGGWRWTYGGHPKPDGGAAIEPEALRQQLQDKYKITWNVQSFGKHSYQREAGWFDAAEMPAEIESLQAQLASGTDPHFKVLHESRSSTAIIRRFSEYFGGAPYAMPEAEKTKLEQQIENVKKYNLALKQAEPRARIVLINDYPAMANEYLARGFPKEAFDVIGLEGAMFLRSPERQPDWMCLTGQIMQMKRSMAKYGYAKPIWTTEALYHPTEAGGLSLHEQGVIVVREAMMALQIGVERMAAAGLIKDCSDDYHWSNWGSCGYCFRDPEINPKPAYAMYAWLTQVLDQAKPAGHLKTPNDSLHVVDFQKPDGSHVYGLWLAKGVQVVVLKATGKPVVYDVFGNVVPTSGTELTLTVSNTPQYVTGATLEAVVSATPIEQKAGPGTRLLDFDQPEMLKASEQNNAVLDSAWETPRIKGNFQTSFVKEDGATAMKVTLLPDADPRKVLPRYVTYDLAKPIALEGRPEEFLLRVKGNSGWGRIMFEVVDAEGRVFTSSGSQYSGGTNSADSLGESFVSFEGWHTIRFPVVGMYPGADQTAGRPFNYNWWPTNTPEEAALGPKNEALRAAFEVALAAHEVAMAEFNAAHSQWEQAAATAKAAGKPAPREPKALDAPKSKVAQNLGQSPVKYPLKLTRLLVDMRPHILYLDEERPVANPTIFLDRLGVTGPLIP